MEPLGSIRYGPEIDRAARRHGISPTLLAAVAAQETGGPGSDSGRNVIGDGGHGHGVFQIDDRSWAFASTSAAMDPAQNADAAATILANDLAATHGDVRGALSMYNSGSATGRGTPTTWADGTTLDYADSVLRHALHLDAATGARLGGGSTTTMTGAGADVGALGVRPAVTGGSARLADLLALVSPNLGWSALGSAGAGTPSSSAVMPQKTWRDMTGSSDAGQAADSGNADILDTGDIFDDPGDGDDA